jgi:hypothetical protein
MNLDFRQSDRIPHAYLLTTVCGYLIQLLSRFFFFFSSFSRVTCMSCRLRSPKAMNVGNGKLARPHPVLSTIGIIPWVESPNMQTHLITVKSNQFLLY